MNTVLDQVRAEYEQMSLEDLVDEVSRQGFIPIEVTATSPSRPPKQALVEFLMNVEEYACFH